MARRRRRKIGKYGVQQTPRRTVETNAKGLIRKNQRVDSAQAEPTNGNSKKTNGKENEAVRRPVFSREDKRYMLAFLGISIAITAFYWYIGGRNLFVFPAIFLLSVGTSRFWRGPVRRFAEDAKNNVSDKTKKTRTARVEETTSAVNKA